MNQEAPAVNEKIHPDDHMYKVMVGNNNAAGYIPSGRRNTMVFRNLVKEHNPSLLRDVRLLDYGCGHGRMTRHMPSAFSPSVLVAADVLEGGVRFCAEELGTVPFVISNDNPISNYDGKFDVIISVSVFTHLPMPLFKTTLAALSEVLDNEGLLLFTANGDAFLKRKNVELTDGFYFGNINPRKAGGASKLPLEEYGQTCVSPEFMDKLFQETGLQLVKHIPEGHVGYQDIYVVKH